MTILYYAGIGSRETPDQVLRYMTQLGYFLAEQGLVLRSGGAEGADLAFERGALAYAQQANLPVPAVAQIFAPWRGFNSAHRDTRHDIVGWDTPELAAQAEHLASQVHPAWHRCSQGARKMHARNCAQILGPALDPQDASSFVVCWTKNGLGGGGTGQAIRLARQHKIPILDLGDRDMSPHKATLWIDQRLATLLGPATTL